MASEGNTRGGGGAERWREAAAFLAAVGPYVKTWLKTAEDKEA